MKQRPDKNEYSHCIDWGLEVANGTVFLFSCTPFKKDQELEVVRPWYLNNS